MELEELLSKKRGADEDVPAEVVDGIRRICLENDKRKYKSRVTMREAAIWMAGKGCRGGYERLQWICRNLLGRSSFGEP